MGSNNLRTTDKSEKAFKRAQNLFPGGVNSPVRAFKSVGGHPFVVSKGSGAYIHDLDGNQYIDFVGSWGPLVLGHAHPEVVDAITKQLALGTSFGACCELESELAEKIISLMPSIEMLRFVNSGTEAGMSVLRLARGFTSRAKILKFEGCYHGHADALLAKAGSGVATLGLPDCAGVNKDVVRDTLTVPFNDATAVQKIFNDFGREIAAIIIEPVVGNSGLIKPDPGFLPFLRNISTQYGSLLIFDEVMTGFRVDLGGAQKLFNVMPDLTMLGKVIGGGLPVGAFGGRRDIMQHLAPIGNVYQAGTLSGNPLAMAAGLTTLKIWSSSNVFSESSKLCQQLMDAMSAAAKTRDIPLSATSVGTMFGFFFQAGPVHNLSHAKNSDLDRFKNFFHAALNAGIYFAPSQFEAGFISSAHSQDIIKLANEKIKEIFNTL